MSQLRLIFVFTVLLLLASQVLAATSPGHPRYKADELICRLQPGYSIDSINATFGTVTKSHQQATDCYLLIIPQGHDADTLAAQIGEVPGVVYCRPNYYLSTPEGLQRSSPFLDQQFKTDITKQIAVTTLNLAAAQTVSTGDGVNIALIDGGADFDHPEFDRTAGLVIPRYDYVDGDIYPFDEPGGSSSGHGTFVAGLLKLVAPDADIYIYRVLDTGGMGDGYSIADAVLQAIDDSCQVISLSLGMVGIHDALDDALKLAQQHDITVVASAGNDSTDLSSIFPFPASRPYCLTVAALDSVNLKADFSNYGLKIDLCAPGTWVYGPYPDSQYAWWSGTSFSVPFVAGTAALLASAFPELSSNQRDTLLWQSATSIDSLDTTFAGLLGYGLVNPAAALQYQPVILGDLTRDGTVDLIDLSTMIAYLISRGLPNPGPPADLNCSGVIDLTDLSQLIAYLTVGTPISCP